MKHIDDFLSAFEGVRASRSGWYARCPVHRDRVASLSISLGEGNRILFQCHVCGAAKNFEILKRIGRKWSDLYAKGTDRYAPPPVPQAEKNGAKESTVCKEAYAYLSANVPLAPEDWEMLRKRGLSEQHIEEDGYFSTDMIDARDIDRLSCAVELGGCPGFHTGSSGRTYSTFPIGLAIPVRNRRREIVSVQIRCRETGPHSPKYQWPTGTVAAVHVPIMVDVDRTGGEVWVTEGPLKADIATILSGHRVLGVPGAGAWPLALPVLREMEPAAVVIAFDADRWVNDSVQRACERFATALMQEGWLVREAYWPLAAGKGIDDVLAARRDIAVRDWGTCGEGEQRQGATERAGGENLTGFPAGM